MAAKDAIQEAVKTALQKNGFQYDGTEVGIANELVARGVPKQDIVLAFHAPYLRQFTEFAVG